MSTLPPFPWKHHPEVRLAPIQGRLRLRSTRKPVKGILGVLRSPLVQIIPALLVLCSDAWAQNVEFRQSSLPAGVVNQTTFPQVGSQASTFTAPENPSGNRFTHWTLNGVRFDDSTGRAQNPVAFTISEPVNAIAHYLPENQDSDSDGVADWMEIHFLGTLNSGAASGGRVDFRETSSPAGVVNQTNFPQVGSQTSTVTAPENPSGNRFTHWTLNGVRFDDSTGRAQNPVGFTISEPVNAIAHYLPENQDSDSDGVADWMEIHFLGTLNSGEASGDRVDFRETSSPAGVVNQTSFPLLGSRATTVTAPENPSGYRFTHWTLNGIRHSHPSGRAKNPVSFTVIDPIHAIAHYLPATQDSDSDGLLDWMEVHYLGSVSSAADDDSDGDGLSNRVEVDRGYDLAAFDTLSAGGVSRRRSGTISLQIADPTLLDNDRDGFIRQVEDLRGYRDDVIDRLEPGGSSRRRSLPLWAVPSANFVRLRETSSPQGVLVNERIVSRDSTVELTEAPLTSNGYRFTGWFIDGVRVDRPPLHQPVTLNLHQDTHAVARYIAETADTDADGIADWIEWLFHDTLDHNLTSDPDGDSLAWEIEQFRGYSTLAADHLQAGGVSRRRSAAVLVDPSARRLPWRMTSLPAGMVNDQGLAVPGSTITTPDLATSAVGNVKFTFWEVNGVRQTDPGGYSRSLVSILVNQPVVATARYFDSTLDDDFDGILDGYELAHFGNTNRTAADDGDRDGLTLSGEIFRGYSPLVRDRIEAGGLSRRRSQSLGVNTVQLNAPPYLTINGATEVASTSARLNALVNPAGLPATVFFEYGPTPAYGFTSQVQTLTGTSGAVAASTLLTGLQPATVYHFRVVAENARGVTTTAGVTFSTLWNTSEGEGFEDSGALARWQITGGVWAARSGSAFTGGTGVGTGADYPANAESRFISPLFEVPALAQFPRLGFDHRWAFGSGDSGTIEIREGTTGVWQIAATIVGQSPGWIDKELDLSAFSGRRIQVAFRFRSGATANAGTGWDLDNVGLVTGAPAGWIADTSQTFQPEAFWRDWTAVGTAWDCGTPASGPGAAFEGDTCAATVLAGNYPANFDGRLVSPLFQVPSSHLTPRLRFWQWYDFGSGDRGTVEVRRIGGPWLPLATWTGAGGNSWGKPSVNLSAFAGEWVQVAFRQVTDAFDQRSGWYIDLAEIVTGADVLNNPETFEADTGDWRADAGGIWQIGRPFSGPGGARSGNNLAATNLSGNYPANSVARLESPAFVVGDPGPNRLVTLRFWHWHQYGAGDGGSLEISVQDREIWSDWVPLLSVTASSGGWKQAILDLGAYRGKTVRLGFLHTADGDGSTGPGWYVDDIEITSIVRGELSAGVPVRNDISSPGEPQYYVLNLDSAGPLLLSLANGVAGNRIELFASRGTLPSRGSHEHGDSSGPGSDRSILIPWASAGTWYVLVYADAVLVPGTFTLEAAPQGVALTSVSPGSHASNAPITLALSGAGFQPGTTVQLVGDGRTIGASSLSVDSITRLTATFSANAVPPGSYAVRVSRPGGFSATLPAAFESLDAGEPKLETKLVMPGAIQPGAPATIYVEYSNTGNASMPAPLLQVRAPEGSPNRPILTLDPNLTVQNFWAGTESLPPGGSTEIFILASGNQPGLLQPGESFQVPVYFTGLLQPWSATSLALEIRYWTSDNPDSIDWAPLKSQLRPPTLNAAVWDVIFNNLTGELKTTADYVAMLNDNAAFLGRLGQRVIDVAELWNFELQQAYGYSPLPVLDSVTDAAVASPGVSLSIDRRFSSNLRSRWESGPFGRGWFTSWQTHLVSENGDAVVRIIGEGGSARVFVRDTRNGRYFSGAGDSAKLTAISGNAFELRSPDGSVTRFNSQGRIGVVDDANGNRVSATYSSNRLATLTHSSGATITLDYDGSGRITQATESTGRSVTYGYQGDYLVSATTGDGKVTSYTYLTQGIPARLHALSSITRAGVTRSFSWDERGRLASSAVAGDQQVITFGYDSAGGVSIADAFGATAFSFDHRGLLAKMVDPLGNITTSEYDKDLRLKRLLLPSGDSRSFTWCSCGSPATITDELGHTTRFSYEHPLKKMTAFIDAKGNRTEYSYDTKGNLLATTYADQSVESLAGYDAAGLPASRTNRRGQTSTFTYTPQGQIARRTLYEGDIADFDYDARGNLIRVTEQPASGPQKITTYDYTTPTDGDRLRKVSYPNGGWVEYFYDTHGRRSRMVDSAGGDTRYEYNPTGQLWKLRDSTEVAIVEYLYDEAGRLSRINKGNGTYTTYQYDTAGQILMLVNHAPDGTPTSSFAYTYDVRGRRTRMETQIGVWSYTYDATNQLVQAIFASQSTELPNQHHQYYYDSLGCRTQSVVNGKATPFTTNNLNQYINVGSEEIQHDTDGNIKTLDHQFYAYDSLNRLTQVSGPAGVTEYEYDPQGNRIASIINGERKNFLLDPTGIISVLSEEITPSQQTLQFTYGHGLVSSKLGNEVNWFDFDSIGSTIAISNTQGVGQHVASYGPFGEELISGTLPPGRAHYVGQLGVTSEQNGVHFMRARFYSSTLGTFIQADPLGLTGGDPNFYRYVYNRPTDLIDPRGLQGIAASTSVGYFFPTSIPFVNVGGGGGWSAGTGGACASGFGGISFGAPGLAVSKSIGGMPSTGWDGITASIGYGVGEASITWHPDDGFSVSGGVGNGDAGKWGGSITTGATACTPPPPPPKPPTPPPPPQPQPTPPPPTPIIVARDPNEKLGPGGYGPANWVRSGDLFPYRINFENLGPGSKDENGNPYPTFATAPAQRVTVTDALPANFDWSTFRITELGFGDTVVQVPGDSTHYSGSVFVTIDGHSFDVEMEAGIDFNTGLVTVVFQSIDRETGLPPGAGIGFLPPEDESGRGMGHVSFLIRPKAGLANGTPFRNVAEIRFDTNEVIATNQVDPQDASKGTNPAKEALVTLDSTAPLGGITALPSVSGLGEIQVSWTGDDQGGSGVESYDVFVSVAGGAFVPWLEGTPETHGTYTATTAGLHAFYVRARDFVGQTSSEAPFAQASTNVVPGLSLANLSDGADVNGRLGVDLALASLPTGVDIARVAYFGNGVLLGEGVGTNFNLRWFPASSGHHRLRAVAYGPDDKESAAGEVEVDVSHVGTYAGALKGSYLGLIREAAPDWLTSGSMSMTSTATGAFTFKILMGGRTLSGRGGFNPQGIAEVSIPRRGNTPLRLQLVHSSVPDVDRIVGRLTDGSYNGPAISGQTFATDFVVDRQVWHAKRNPATAHAGAYTAILLHGPDGPPTADLPYGPGHGAISITTGGGVKFTGQLAEGARVSAATYLSKDAEWPLYLPLYRNNGFVIGKPALRNVVNVSDGDGTLHWWKRANPTSLAYPGEIKTETRILLAKYQIPQANTRPLVLSNLGGNVLAALNDFSLPSAMERIGTMNAGGSTVFPPQGGERLVLSFSPRTGSFSGSFVHPRTGGRTRANGVVFQKQNFALGRYLAGPAGGRIMIEPHPDRMPDGNDQLPIGLTPLPVLRISSPRAESIVTPVNGVLEISGSAKDAQGIASVWYQVLHDGVMEAPALAEGTTLWKFPVTIPEDGGGRYSVIAKAIDGAGNESVLTTRSFLVSSKKPLHVTTTGPGVVSHGFLGSTDRQIGQLVTITSTPARGKRFSGWKGSIESPARTISFLMEEGITLEAVFED